MGCGSCGGARKDIKVQFTTKTCPKCGWVLQKVHKFSPVSKRMLETWVCPNNKCNYTENGK